MEDTTTYAILSLEDHGYSCIFKNRDADDCEGFRKKLASHCRIHNLIKENK